MRLGDKDDIVGAANRINGTVLRTPLVPTTLRGRQLWLKPENLQADRRVQGARRDNVLAGLSESDRARGVVAYSSGNHAQAVALRHVRWACRR